MSTINIFIQPFLTSKIFAYFTLETNQAVFKQSLLAAIGLYLYQIMFNFFMGYCIFLQNKISLRITVALSSLVYRKLLKLKTSNILNGTFGEGGNIVTLITKDVFMFESIINELSILLCFPFTLAFSIYLVYSKVGAIGLSCLGVILTITILEVILSKIMHDKRIKVDLDTARRVEIIREALSAIKLIKIFAWEKHFIEKIKKARKIEIKGIFVLNILKFFIWFVGVLNVLVPFYIFINIYLYANQDISIGHLLYVMTVLKNLRPFFINFLPKGITGLAEVFAAMKRIHKFLTLGEIASQQYKINCSSKILFNNVNLGSKSLLLRNITLDLNKKDLVLITGDLGAGKSILLKSIVGEVDLSGSYTINGRMSYASQEPWIFPSTIKQNILFGEEFNKKRYDDVLNVCALSYDIKHFDKGDETVLIDGGANISKGQQARISLARAIYRKADIYLLDDCLNTLDEKIGLKVFQDSTTFLKDSIVLMVTQNPAHFNSCCENVKIVLVRDGSVSSLEHKSNVASIIFDNKTEEDFTGEKDQYLNNANTIFEAKETDRLLKTSSYKNIYHEDTKNGSISMKTFGNYVKHCGGFYIFIFSIILFSVHEISSILSQKSLMFWITAEEQIMNHINTNATNYTERIKYEETLNTQTTYFIIYNTSFYLYVIFGIMASILHFFLASKASIRIHKSMSEKVICAEAHFFDTHLFGNIINRFSKDIYHLDENIPFSFFHVLMYGMEILGTLILIAISNWILLCLVVILCVIGFIVMKFVFLPIGSNLKRLESAVHSPMIGHLNATLDGLTTIRAHGNHHLLKQQFDNYQNRFSSAYFTHMTVKKGFSVTIDLFIFLLLFLVFCYFYLGKNITAAEVAVILSTVMHLFGYVKVLNRQLNEFLALMTSAERAFNYFKIKTENQNGIEVDNWPENSAIIFDKVALTYPTNKHQVLKEINLEIMSNTKIAITGRTGSGKSSLINAIFRFYETEGRILIDDTDIKNFSLNYRSKIGVVFQKPILFSGNIRENLDPDYMYKDDDLWNVLNMVKLGFDLYDNTRNLNLSTGQKQLLCIGRVLLTKAKIIILDEVTSDLDPKTESYICEIINEYFKNFTVIAITHKNEILKIVDKVFCLNEGYLEVVK